MSEVERIAEDVRSGNGRSPLLRWMRRNHDRLAEAMDGERPDWKALTAEFAALGLVPADAKPGTVRHVWWRARQAVAKARQKRPARQAVTPHQVMPETAPHDPLAALRQEMAKRSGRGG